MVFYGHFLVLRYVFWVKNISIVCIFPQISVHPPLRFDLEEPPFGDCECAAVHEWELTSHCHYCTISSIELPWRHLCYALLYSSQDSSLVDKARERLIVLMQYRWQWGIQPLLLQLLHGRTSQRWIPTGYTYRISTSVSNSGTLITPVWSFLQAVQTLNRLSIWAFERISCFCSCQSKLQILPFVGTNDDWLVFIRFWVVCL